MDYYKKKYDECRVEICDEKGNHKPIHSSAVILCLLEEILEKLNKQSCCCNKCCRCKEIETIEAEPITQTGVVNIDAIVETAKKKK